MTTAFAAWSVAAVCAALSIILFLRLRALAVRAADAERRFDLLQDLAPALTSAAKESTAATCGRILERIGALVPCRTLLCFVVRDGRLELGAKSGEGYAGFLREGMTYDGDTIVDWALDRASAAIVGPREAVLRGVEVADLVRDCGGTVGPAAGSRDRVWALAIPLAIDRSRGLAPAVIGVVYLERPRTIQFSADDVRTAMTAARVAADALARALFADAIRRDLAVDPLTRLLTPTAFRTRLREEVATGRDVALFFIDTDHFKNLNDTYGHAAGDRLLRSLAAKFSQVAAASAGFAGRNGGDEFCIALPDRTKDAAVEIAEHVRASIDSGNVVPANGIPASNAVTITVSIGVAHYPVDVSRRESGPADRLLEIADEQMYEAKRAGRNRVEYVRAGIAARADADPGEGPISRR